MPTLTIEDLERAIERTEELRAGRQVLTREEVDEIAARVGYRVTNEDRSRVEVQRFIHERPERHFAYHDGGPCVGDEITTWTGDLLARVVSRGEVWRSNMGDRRQSFRARAINGVTYSGTAYLDAGSYVRMRRMKG